MVTIGPIALEHAAAPLIVTAQHPQRATPEHRRPYAPPAHYRNDTAQIAGASGLNTFSAGTAHQFARVMQTLRDQPLLQSPPLHSARQAHARFNDPAYIGPEFMVATLGALYSRNHGKIGVLQKMHLLQRAVLKMHDKRAQSRSAPPHRELPPNEIPKLPARSEVGNNTAKLPATQNDAPVKNNIVPLSRRKPRN